VATLVYHAKDYQQLQMLAPTLEIITIIETVLETITIIETIEVHVDIHTSAATHSSFDLGQIHQAVCFAFTPTAEYIWDNLLFVCRHSFLTRIPLC